ncbi:ABC transporter permease [Vibrio japonicus]|uniref:FtsX-like permease family protein n=1 Tax=Vibrio japonicus TaxID=1824638 RepID=A0ABY5LP72_9VIBR|nr:FtsX-like permease family protein [Vibrio japonicus]UUM32676.1 FtsX-like permease family protein [Vibrio japonicus]
MLIRLAWRNLWRQKRRTVLTSSALALALFLSLLTRSFQEGSYNANIENAARFYTGLIQLQHPDFYTSNSIDDVLPQSQGFIQPAFEIARVTRALPRIESVALAASGDRSKGVMVLGVEPEREDAYSNISAKLSAGEFLRGSDKAVLVGESLAQYLQLSVGDELVLYGQGYRGQTAAGLFQVMGILHFPLQQLDNQLVYMPLMAAQQLYSTQGLVTNWVLDIADLKQLDEEVAHLKMFYEPDVVVKDWQALSPELAQQILMDKTSGIFLVYVLYGIVGFGLFATILMMTLERQREFAVMLATGMLRIKLANLVLLESLFIACAGVILGLILSTPVLAYFYFNPIEFTGDAAQLMRDSGFEPILPVLIDGQLVVNQIITVLIIMLLCLIYPIWRISKLNVARALKGGGYAR